MVAARRRRPTTALQLSAAVFAGLALLGCEADIVGKGEGGAMSGAGAGGQVLEPGVQPTVTCNEHTPPGEMFLRRLTNQEYQATLSDLLGVKPDVSKLPPELSLYGFENNAESISLSTAHLEQYQAIAEKLA